MPYLIVSKNLETLCQRISEEQLACPVLLFDGSKAHSVPPGIKVIRPDADSAVQRLRLLDEYVELISRIGAANRYSSTWLSHPLSEKNDLEPNPLFQQVIDFIGFRRAWDALGGTPGLAVHASRKSLMSNIVAFAQAESIPIETPGVTLKPPTLIRETRRRLRRLHTELQHVRKLKRYAHQTRPFLERIRKGESVTLIRTWFDLRSRGEIEEGRDVFLGPLPGYLAREGRRLLFYGGLTDIDRRFEPIEAHLREIRAFPVLPEVALLRGLDRWTVALRTIMLARRIRFPKPIVLDGIEVTDVLRGYLKKRYPTASFRKNLMSQIALKRLLDRVRIDEIYMPFENNSWQKLLTCTVRERDSAIRIKAFQHAQIARNSSRLFLGKEELRKLPLPDFIFTLGSYTREFLVHERGYPPERVLTACALRQDRLPESNGVRLRRGRLLACLWTMRRSVDVLRFLSEAGLEAQGWRVRIRPHPVQPIERVKLRLDRALPDTFEISAGPFADDLKDCDVVLYNGTTACLDALAVGLPVINVEFEDFISPDPLFEFDAFKWTVRSGEELIQALNSIRNLPDEEFLNRREAAKEFVEGYFNPVTEECMRKIVEFGSK